MLQPYRRIGGYMVRPYACASPDYKALFYLRKTKYLKVVGF